MAGIMARCGLFCDECDKYNKECKGCYNDDRTFNTFTGKCEVRHCVESQGLEHCGKCNSFPCENLEYLSFADQFSDCGQRIRNCESHK